MRTSYWILFLAVILILCLGLSIPLLLPGQTAAFAQIISDGQLIGVVDLSHDQEILVTTESGGSNTIAVRDGKIGVTAATCPDHYCMDRGMCQGGAQIVCLPNRLIIRFLGEQSVDAVVG